MIECFPQSTPFSMPESNRSTGREVASASISTLRDDPYLTPPSTPPPTPPHDLVSQSTYDPDSSKEPKPSIPPAAPPSPYPTPGGDPSPDEDVCQVMESNMGFSSKGMSYPSFMTVACF